MEEVVVDGVCLFVVWMKEDSKPNCLFFFSFSFLFLTNRVSIGIEHIDDIKADFDQAIAAALAKA